MSDHLFPETDPEVRETIEEPIVAAAEPQPPLPIEEADRLAATQTIIDQWMRDRISGSPVALNTAAYNHLRRALPELARNLVKGQ